MLLIMRFWGCKKVSITLVLVMHFPEPISMLLPKREYSNILSLSQSSLCGLYPKMYNMVKEIWKGKTKVDENLY